MCCVKVFYTLEHFLTVAITFFKLDGAGPRRRSVAFTFPSFNNNKDTQPSQTCSEGYTFSATALYRGVSLFFGSIN